MHICKPCGRLMTATKIPNITIADEGFFFVYPAESHKCPSCGAEVICTIGIVSTEDKPVHKDFLFSESKLRS